MMSGIEAARAVGDKGESGQDLWETNVFERPVRRTAKLDSREIS